MLPKTKHDVDEILATSKPLFFDFQLATTIRMFAKTMVFYAQLERNAREDKAFLGNNARDILAAYLQVDVKQLEPGTASATELLATV